MPTAKSLILAAGSAALYTTRYVTQRIHRKLDERDNLIRDAIQKLEEKSLSEWPCLLELDKQLSAGGTASHTRDYILTGKHLANSAKTAYVEFFNGEDYNMFFEAVLPGKQTFSVKLISSEAANSTISWAYSAGVLTGTIGTQTTPADLVTDIDGGSLAAYYIKTPKTAARGSTDVTDTTALTATELGASGTSVAMDNGEGDLFELYVGSVAVVPGSTANSTGIYHWEENSSTNVTTIKFDVTVGDLTANTSYNIIASANQVSTAPLSGFAKA